MAIMAGLAWRQLGTLQPLVACPVHHLTTTISQHVLPLVEEASTPQLDNLLTCTQLPAQDSLQPCPQLEFHHATAPSRRSSHSASPRPPHATSCSQHHCINPRRPSTTVACHGSWQAGPWQVQPWHSRPKPAAHPNHLWHSHAAACKARAWHVRHASSSTYGGGSGATGSASQQEADGTAAPDLKTALRRLYKRVHPDLFSDDLSAKAENERSFKLLQEYLHQARQGGRDLPQSRVMYTFRFYLREPTLNSSSGSSSGGSSSSAAGSQQGPAAGAQAASSSSSSSSRGGQAQAAGHDSGASGAAGISKFKRVELALPPPAQPQVGVGGGDADGTAAAGAGGTEPSSSSKKRLAPSVRKGLMKLFVACGVQVVPGLGEVKVVDGVGATEEDLEVGDSSRLSSFLPHAMEAQRLAQASNLEPAVRVANMRGAFRLQRKLLVSFQGGPSSLPASQQVSHLLELATILDTLSYLNLEGASIVLGDTLGVDKLGNLCLDVRPGGGGGAAWTQLLLGVDMDFVRSRKAYMHAVKDLERRVAVVAGLASVFASLPAVAAEPTYRSFLERLAHTGATTGMVADGAFKDVPLCVLPTYAFRMQQQQQQAQTSQAGGGGAAAHQGAHQSFVDGVQGVLCVPDELSASQVYAEVRAQGPEVQRCIRNNMSRRQDLSALVLRVRTALHLRHLTRDERLADSHFQACCTRLLRESDALGHVTDGATLRIGFANRVWPDGTQVEIAHNFVY